MTTPTRPPAEARATCDANVGERIRQRRAFLGLSYARAAARTGLSASALHKIEHGASPTARNLRKIADGLGLDPRQLLSERRRLRVGDYVRFPRPSGKTGVWRVRSVVLGGVGQESVYGLEVVDADHPTDEWGVKVTEMYVPTVMVEALA